MKLIPVLIAATLPLAAQTTNPAPSSSSSDSSVQIANPADSEPVVNAPAVSDSNTTNAPASMPAPTVTEAPSVSAMATPPALSPDPFSDPLIAKIAARYQKAWDGDKKETKSLTADLEHWTKDEPNNYLFMAYLGSAYALDSRDAWIGPGKLSYLKKGSAELDAAVSGDPSNPAIRLLRAMNYLEIPSIFGKRKAAHEDFEYLTQQLAGVLPLPYSLTNDTKQAIYYYAGLSDAQNDDLGGAKQAWETGLALAPTSPLGQKMQAELDKHK